MQVLVRTDHNIEGREALADRITDVVERALTRVRDRITRVEVHLSDENSDKKGGGLDMRCVIEARLEGRPPVAVTDHAATMDQAVSGATHKLARSLDRVFGRLHDKRSRGSEK
ncbi:MAG: HPF/RaiA family ribosome-associated protein [Acidobacteria bacterium]|nr:HPF/RaiA family ribosome-associated protein [Acidobacteriota bacterium]